MVELRGDRLTFSFPAVHEQARGSLSFQRTLRIPDDNREHSLPPGLGDFPLHHVDDHIDRLPSQWRDSRRSLHADVSGGSSLDTLHGRTPPVSRWP